MNLAHIPIESLPGVGGSRKEDLNQLGIFSIHDLFQYYPFRYDDTHLSDLSCAEDGSKVTVQGTIVSTPSIKWYSKRKSRIAAQLEVPGQRRVHLVWFNQAYLKDKLLPGHSIAVLGKWDRSRSQITPDRTFISEQEQREQIGRLQPVYPITASITMNWLRRLMYEAFVRYGQHIQEIIPDELVTRYKLFPRPKAMYLIHFPKGNEEHTHARRRMIYEELFLYELKILWLKKMRELKSIGLSHVFNQTEVEDFIQDLPFPLTAAQERVVQEILSDLKSPIQMNRLLQGDVGSGKTVVAAIAFYANYLSGFQGALMVPTEILAEQHALSLERSLSPRGMNIVRLTGSMTTKERRQILTRIELGSAHVIVGTHALIQEAVHYHQLGFVVIDEQHRFGVKQRSKLREKGEVPDVLFMTATPIPRTLAITAFGEMDVSTIDEMPAGREPVETHWVRKDAWPKVIHFMDKECGKGKQVYVVCPLIEESEKLDLQNAQELYAELGNKLPALKIGLLHGRMSQIEKDEVMNQFKQNKLHALVSTTVIEVGVNVPNATVMVIYDADRFGLAQLHQLRGRVGRGGGASHCVLVANPKSEAGMERMRIMMDTTDGFEISRRDLELRGPGDFLGVRQSGVPDFRIADLMEDYRILEIARKDVMEIISHQKFAECEEYQCLWEFLGNEGMLDKKLD